MNKVAVLVLMLMTSSVFAVEVAGVAVPDSVKLANQHLVLNGAGVRSKFVVKVYVGALYVSEKSSSVDAVVQADAPKRLLMHFLYSKVDRKKIVEAWNDGFKENNSALELKQLAPRIASFNSLFRTMKAGDEVLLDYIPKQGTVVSINDRVAGVIKGLDFNQALLRIWLGPEPVTDDLKDALLGR